MAFKKIRFPLVVKRQKQFVYELVDLSGVEEAKTKNKHVRKLKN